MKLSFLGTAAAEGFPAVFCNCEFCREARKLGGRNIRTRSQALINDDLLIDLPADTYSHFLSNGIEGDKIKYLLVTHSHGDHFYCGELEMHYGAYAHNMRSKEMQMYCNKGTAAKFDAINHEKWNVSMTVMKPFETVTFGEYTVTALPARHFYGDEALFYIIKSDKTILYAHDTGYFYDEVFDFLEKEGIKFDLVTLDCNYGDLERDDESTHMGISNIKRVVKRLSDIGSVTKATKTIINHFSHNSNPIHHRLEECVADVGYTVSYDGLAIEI